MIAKDPEYERLLKEEWLNLAINKYQFSAYRELEKVKFPIVIPPEKFKDFVSLDDECGFLVIREKSLIRIATEQITKNLSEDAKFIFLQAVDTKLFKSKYEHISLPQQIDLRNPPTIEIPEEVFDDLDEECLNRAIKLITSCIVVMKHIKKDKILHTLIDILTPNPGKVRELKKDKRSKKKEWLIKRITEIFTTNEYNIRNIDLIIQFSDWLEDYAINESIYALTMLSKLKILTHSKNPIYSVE